LVSGTPSGPFPLSPAHMVFCRGVPDGHRNSPATLFSLPPLWRNFLFFLVRCMMCLTLPPFQPVYRSSCFLRFSLLFYYYDSRRPVCMQVFFPAPTSPNFPRLGSSCYFQIPLFPPTTINFPVSCGHFSAGSRLPTCPHQC